MTTAAQIQYSPNKELDDKLVAAGASKTVYALVTPEVEAAKTFITHDPEYLSRFRGAWTKKQDTAHHEFFDAWVEWSKPLVALDRKDFPFYYPCNGASEALRHLIYKYGCDTTQPRIHVFEGEYEGYSAFAKDANVKVVVHDREDWRNSVLDVFQPGDLFFISQPSAIDGNVWTDFNRFLDVMERFGTCVVADLTYVGAIADEPAARFNMTFPSVRNVVFSLSKPFGAYYDRIGGVFCREEDGGLFGNAWFKNLTSLALGTRLLTRHGVYELPRKYAPEQDKALAEVGTALGLVLRPADIYILAVSLHALADKAMDTHLRRTPNGLLRVCLTPKMAEMIGTT